MPSLRQIVRLKELRGKMKDKMEKVGSMEMLSAILPTTDGGTNPIAGGWLARFVPTAYTMVHPYY